MTCGEMCSACSDGDICIECGTCKDCSDSEGFCSNCGLCGSCTITCVCGEGCEQCADLCPECGEKCSECYDEFCASCDLCRECAGEDAWCSDCSQCGNCTDICEDCGEVCSDCAYQVCEECGKCSGCIDEFCPECNTCIECADAMCEDCNWCSNCAEVLCEECGYYCSECADICPDCGVCNYCADICSDCGKCAECCVKESAGYGCTHEICVNSSEWESHYCTAGNHCVDDSSKIEYNENTHWVVCGDGCNVRLNEGTHLFGDGEIVREPTNKEEGIMILPCKACDYEKEVKIPKTTNKHTHEYTDTVTAPTCAENGYTTHTCECGYTWVDNETPATDHDYETKYNADEHWQECSHCHAVDGKAKHKLGEWKTVLKAGYTYNGVKQRECKCGYTLAEEIPMLTVPEDKVVITIPDFTITDKPSVPVGDPSDSPDGSDTTKPDGSDTSKPEGDKTPTAPTITTKELLTKGDDNTVPALPTLPPTEDGNIFDGWVDKGTGEPVKKGDKITGNIELAPVWKDCGEDNHKDEDEDNSCDECGHILVKETPPVETLAPEETDPPADAPSGDDEPDNSKLSTGGIAAIAGSGVALVALALALIFSKKKKNKE